MVAFDQLKKANPDGRFWLKLDATDLKEALMESVSGVWNQWRCGLGAMGSCRSCGGFMTVELTINQSINFI